ncbi:MAG TPA: substrate-binding domain-containing protein [Bryobacteraceae bacterium]|nr:substrate-binding domain-containing protein [Bryobacteraceae bacterium]
MRKRFGTVVVLCALLCACNRSTQKRVAFIPKGRAHVFWQSVHAGAVAAMRENPGYAIIWNGPASETDFEGQIQIVDAAINQHVDAICLAPIDKKVLVSVVDRAAAQNIPVVIFDSPIDTNNFVAQVATDNYAGGQLGAARVGELLQGKGKVAEVAVQPGSASTMARESGFEEKLAKDFPGIKLVDKQYGMADFGQSLKVAENMLTAAPDLNGMFASNESSTVGAVRALKDKKSVKLVGFDSSPQLVEALKDGVVDSMVVQDPFQMGYQSMLAAVTKLKGGSPQRIQNITPTLVTRENMNTPEIQKKINPDLDKYLK